MFKEIELKLSLLEDQKYNSNNGPANRLRNEMLLNNSQYKKILELMLDLEKKMDKKFVDAHHETANAIVQALDVNLLKKDIDD